MILPGAVLLPGTLLPLFVFEPRYRAMLAEALASHRLFGISSSPAAETDPEVLGIAGIGFVRACVANPNGTSNLVLQGIGRVHLEEWVSPSEYPLARIESVETPSVEESVLSSRREEVLELISRREEKGMTLPAHFLDALRQTEDPGSLADLGASNFIEDADMRQGLLEEADPLKRLDTLIDYLKK